MSLCLELNSGPTSNSLLKIANFKCKMEQNDIVAMLT